jgi:hypothetical protein
MEVWDRQPAEGPKAYKAFLLYRNLGARRSLDAAYQLSLPEQQKSNKRATGRWTEWSRQFQWLTRAQAWDTWRQAEHERIEQELEKEEIQRVMSLRYAKSYYRVEDLNTVAENLLKEIKETDKVWLPDVKSIGGGEFAERVDLIRFNAQLFQQYRGTLEDIAAELGGRVKKQEVTGKDGGPIQTQDVTLDDAERVARINSLLDKARTRRTGQATGE